MTVNGMLHGVDPSGRSPQWEPLAGIRVLELTRHAGGSPCSWVLGRLGAEVLQLVQPRPAHANSAGAQGDASVAVHSDAVESHGSVQGQPHSLTIDLAEPEGHELILQLAKECDVFLRDVDIEQEKPCGLDYAEVRKVNRRIIYLVQCKQETGSVHAGASRSGLHGAIAVLGALRHREVHGGLGQAIDLALVDFDTTVRPLLPSNPSFAVAHDDTRGTQSEQVACRILSDWLSLSKDQLACLVNEGVI